MLIMETNFVENFLLFPPCGRKFFHKKLRSPPLSPFSSGGIDNKANLWYIDLVKSYDEDTRSGSASQREIHIGARILFADRNDTTSEPCGGNVTPGAPVTASMSGEAIRNQGGTVEYFCIPPLIFIGGWVFFIPSPWQPLQTAF